MQQLVLRFKEWARGIPIMTFLMSSLLVAQILQISSVVILPFSKIQFRRFNRNVANGWWSLVVFCMEKVNRIKIVFSGDKIPSQENAIVVANHQEMTDICLLFTLAIRKKRLGDMKWFVKDIIKYMPGVGWGMLFLDCLFVKRDWARDAAGIKKVFAGFNRDKVPFWLMSFCEGTRITPKKLARAQEFAKGRGMYIPQHVLIPRTKGFTASVEGLRERLDAVYDVTIGYGGAPVTLWQLSKGCLKSAHLHVRRFETSVLPIAEADLAKWLLQRFEEKDRLMGYFYQKGCFPSA